jgi:hypothetical protein
LPTVHPERSTTLTGSDRRLLVSPARPHSIVNNSSRAVCEFGPHFHPRTGITIRIFRGLMETMEIALAVAGSLVVANAVTLAALVGWYRHERRSQRKASR